MEGSGRHVHGRDVVAARWGDEAFNAELRDIYWMACPEVRRYLNRRVTGDPQADWLTWLDRFVLRPHGGQVDVAVLGCGEGWLERVLARSPAVGSLEAFDISAEAVATARRLAAEQDLAISYGVCNLDRDELEPGRWDVVIAHSVIHHVAELEHAYEQIHRALRPGGLLVLNEYVGPNRLQYSDAQLERLNRIMVRLPERLRRSATEGIVYPHRERPDLAHLDQVDPSEAVRSKDVIPAAEQWFATVLARDCGGTILQPLLYDMAQNFTADDEPLLRLMILLEEELVEAGTLRSDFTVRILRRRDTAPDRFRVPHPPPPRRPASGHGRLAAVQSLLSGRDPRNLWGARTTEPGWGGFEALRGHLHERVSGDPACDPATWMLARAESAGSAVVLGPQWLVDLARSRFDRVETKVGTGPVDALLSMGGLGDRVLHDADRVWRVARNLRPGGLLCALEPLTHRGGAPPPPVRELIRQTVAALPEGRGITAPPDPWLRPSGRASLSVATVRQNLEPHLDVELMRPVGWGLLQPLVPRLIGRLDEADELDTTALRLLALLDAQLTDDGVLPSAFALVVATRRA